MRAAPLGLDKVKWAADVVIDGRTAIGGERMKEFSPGALASHDFGVPFSGRRSAELFSNPPRQAHEYVEFRESAEDPDRRLGIEASDIENPGMRRIEPGEIGGLGLVVWFVRNADDLSGGELIERRAKPSKSKPARVVCPWASDLIVDLPSKRRLSASTARC